MSEFIVKNNIKNESTLQAIADAQSVEGKKDLQMSHLPLVKSLNELIQQTWKMKEASATLERKKVTSSCYGSRNISDVIDIQLHISMSVYIYPLHIG